MAPGKFVLDPIGAIPAMTKVPPGRISLSAVSDKHFAVMGFIEGELFDFKGGILDV